MQLLRESRVASSVRRSCAFHLVYMAYGKFQHQILQKAKRENDPHQQPKRERHWQEEIFDWNTARLENLLAVTLDVSD